MFGLSKDERQKSEAISEGLDLVLRQLNEAIYTTADALDINQGGDKFKQTRYLAVIFAFATALGVRVGANSAIRDRALRDYFYAFKDGKELLNITLYGNLYMKHQKLMDKVADYCKLAELGHMSDELTMSLAQVYLMS